MPILNIVFSPSLFYLERVDLMISKAEWLEKNKKNTVIGIAGASGSGKTTVAKKLLAYYGEENCVVISSDNYYKSQSHLSLEERGKLNCDHPETIDFALLAEQLNELKNGKSISIPVNDFVNHTRKDETILVHAKKIIIVEGILVLHPQEVIDLIDVKIFVKTDLEICKNRRISRDIIERGRTLGQVLEQYEATVLPMYFEFVAKTENLANFVVENNSSNFEIDTYSLVTCVDQMVNSKKSHSGVYSNAEWCSWYKPLQENNRDVINYKTDERGAILS